MVLIGVCAAVIFLFFSVESTHKCQIDYIYKNAELLYPVYIFITPVSFFQYGKDEFHSDSFIYPSEPYKISWYVIVVCLQLFLVIICALISLLFADTKSFEILFCVNFVLMIVNWVILLEIKSRNFQDFILYLIIFLFVYNLLGNTIFEKKYEGGKSVLKMTMTWLLIYAIPLLIWFT